MSTIKALLVFVLLSVSAFADGELGLAPHGWHHFDLDEDVWHYPINTMYLDIYDAIDERHLVADITRSPNKYEFHQNIWNGIEHVLNFDVNDRTNHTEWVNPWGFTVKSATPSGGSFGELWQLDSWLITAAASFIPIAEIVDGSFNAYFAKIKLDGEKTCPSEFPPGTFGSTLDFIDIPAVNYGYVTNRTYDDWGIIQDSDIYMTRQAKVEHNHVLSEYSLCREKLTVSPDPITWDDPEWTQINSTQHDVRIYLWQGPVIKYTLHHTNEMPIGGVTVLIDGFEIDMEDPWDNFLDQVNLDAVTESITLIDEDYHQLDEYWYSITSMIIDNETTNQLSDSVRVVYTNSYATYCRDTKTTGTKDGTRFSSSVYLNERYFSLDALRLVNLYGVLSDDCSCYDPDPDDSCIGTWEWVGYNWAEVNAYDPDHVNQGNTFPGASLDTAQDPTTCTEDINSLTPAGWGTQCSAQDSMGFTLSGVSRDDWLYRITYQSEGDFTIKNNAVANRTLNWTVGSGGQEDSGSILILGSGGTETINWTLSDCTLVMTEDDSVLSVCWEFTGGFPGFEYISGTVQASGLDCEPKIVARRTVAAMNITVNDIAVAGDVQVYFRGEAFSPFPILDDYLWDMEDPPDWSEGIDTNQCFVLEYTEAAVVNVDEVIIDDTCAKTVPFSGDDLTEADQRGWSINALRALIDYGAPSAGLIMINDRNL